jgi:16S rRNA (cytidine1402-2'-O)-methyltransferase
MLYRRNGCRLHQIETRSGMTRDKWEDSEASTDPVSIVAERARTVMREQLAAKLAPGLHLVATPIGNLADMTLRALSVLARADVIYCEDTRHSRTLTGHYGITTPLKPYHEHNADAARPDMMRALGEGKSLALISDAGTPLVSDPGFKLVRDALSAGHLVTSLPGPSAVLAALAQSGLPTDTFLFGGFLPTKQGARQSRLRELAAVPATLIFFEAPGRIQETLTEMAFIFPGRALAIARELTKMHEEVVGGSAEELVAWAGRAAPRGEFVVLVAPPVDGAEATDDVVQSHLRTALKDLSLRDAVKAVSEGLSLPRSRVYELAIAMKRDGDAG